MKVAFLMGHLARYDAIGNYTIDIMNEISMYHNISLYAFAADHKLPSITTNFFTRIRKHNLIEEIKITMNPWHLANELSKNDILITVAPQANDILSIPILSKLINPKLILVLDFHGITPPCYHKSLRRRFIEFYRILTVRILGKLSDFVVVHSNYMKNQFFRHTNVLSFVLPIGIDTEKFDSRVDGNLIKKKFQLNEYFTLLYVGRLAPHKRVSFLVEALYKLKNANFKLLIVGSGSEQEQIEKKINSFDLNDKVFFIGQIPDDDLPLYYNACDVFVTGSMHEGVCLPIIESYACGKPSIVPDNTAMPETANGAGLVYAGNSMKSLIKKISLIKNNSNLYKELNEKGLMLAKKRNNKKCAAEYRMFLESIHRHLIKNAS